MTSTRHLAAVALLGILFGCSSSADEPATKQPIPTPSPAAAKHSSFSPYDAGWPYPARINWAKYRPGLQDQTDAAGNAEDCPTLTSLFAEAASAPLPNEELLTYTQRWQVEAGCEAPEPPEPS